MSDTDEFFEWMDAVFEEEYNVSITENGAAGYRTTGKHLLDLHFAVSSLRNATEEDIINCFVKAFYEDKCLAVKWLFLASDVRQGMGERRLFRVLLNYLAKSHPQIAKNLLSLVPEYTRWDNLWCLLDTSLKEETIALVKTQLMQDIQGMKEQKNISLLAKWMPSINATSEETRKLAKQMAAELGMKHAEYRKMLSGLREYLKIVETTISRGDWDKVCYEQVPSRANLLYRNAFLRHDIERRAAYLQNVQNGKAVIHSDVLYPSDIVHNYYENPLRSYWCAAKLKSETDATLEELWKALPDYVQGAGNTICVVDGSGSMRSCIGNTLVTCQEVAHALGIYFAERCFGRMKERYITFSETPRFVDLKNGKTLREKLEIGDAYDEVANTNIEAVFELLLKTALAGKLKQEELPKTILILSDMEFDSCIRDGNRERIESDKLFRVIAQRYEQNGYQLPRLVFWNIASRSRTIPVRENQLGVTLVSGFSPTIMKMVLKGNTDPYECLLEQLREPRYDAVEAAVKESQS